MNSTLAQHILARYREKFTELQVVPREFAPEVDYPVPHTPEERLGHCFWMLDEIERFLNESQLERAYQWLGFVQGCFWSHGIYSVDDLKSHNHGG